MQVDVGDLIIKFKRCVSACSVTASGVAVSRPAAWGYPVISSAVPSGAASPRLCSPSTITVSPVVVEADWVRQPASEWQWCAACLNGWLNIRKRSLRSRPPPLTDLLIVYLPIVGPAAVAGMVDMLI